MERDSGATNQRIQFDIEPCGRHILTGGADGCVRVGLNFVLALHRSNGDIIHIYICASKDHHQNMVSLNCQLSTIMPKASL